MKALAPVRRAFELAERERKFLLSEMSQVSGLMPILMRRRNKQQWTPEELDEMAMEFGLHPLAVVAGVALLAALRPRRAIAWIARGWSLWRLYRGARGWWLRFEASSTAAGAPRQAS